MDQNNKTFEEITYELKNGEFQNIVEKVAKRIKRVKKVKIENYVVYVTVLTSSGISTWDFELDFDFDGYLINHCYIQRSNYESTIPESFRNSILEEIEDKYPGYLAISQEKYEIHVKELERIKQEQERINRLKIEEEERLLKEKREHERQEELKRIKENSKRAFKLIFSLSIFLIIASLVLAIIFEIKMLKPLTFSSNELIGKSYTEVVENLVNAGFTNVEIQDVPDLDAHQSSQENLVTEVSLLYGNSFNEDTKYPTNLPITVVYHTVKLYYVPYTSKDAKGENYLDVMNEFINDGFSNISFNIEYDIIAGWFTKDGEVESISINGSKDYEYYDRFRSDADIVITYHTYKKNKPK